MRHKITGIQFPLKKDVYLRKNLSGTTTVEYGSNAQVAVVVQALSCVRLFATLWTVACQAPLSLSFSRQESWSGLPFPSPGDLLWLLHWQVDPEPPGNPNAEMCTF